MPREFYVDKTAPTLVIAGVADKSANNGKVAPVITCSDTNYNVNGITINLSGIVNGAADINGAFSDIANGQIYTFADFEETKENDDIYTLNVRVVDFAGNETPQRLHILNRFGSVYTFDASLLSIKDSYVHDEIDVVLTETNVDTLNHDTIKLKITKNSVTSDLTEGTDYSIAQSGGNGQWSQYKYTLNKALFSDDGKYTVTLYSVDAAGNINENIDETKEAEISFGIDKTNPVIEAAFEKEYWEKTKLTAVIKDNLLLDGVEIYLNGNKIEYNVDGDTYSFDVDESNEKQDVRFVAVDKAGNKFELAVNDLTVSRNPLVHWHNNTPLFIGSIIGVAALGIVLAALVIGKKKKKASK